MKIGVVLVHYRAAELAATAVAALRKELRSFQLSGEIVVVDNGSSPAEREILAALDARLVEPGANLGYAGGVNRGVEELGDAEVFLLMNPDVEVLPGCLAALVETLIEGAAVAGPRFYWDRQRRFLLPPTEERTFSAELLAILAQRGGFWARPGRRRWRRHARRVWEAREPLSCYALSGALLAIRRDAWETVGPFDADYALYFEETDWLERLRRAGLSARYVPGAEALHHYAQSTAREPRSEAWFVESSRRFRRRWYGPVATGLLEQLSRLWGRRPLAPGISSVKKVRDGEPTWWEVSASSAGYPAAGCRGMGMSLQEIESALPATALCLRQVVD